MSSRPKRRLVSDALAAAEGALSRDSVITVSDEVVPPPSQDRSPAPRAEDVIPPPVRKRGGIRHSYHTSLYLPEEAQFALREIALAMRYPKPHDVMLEAMADLFERYNKSELAAKVRGRMSRDAVTK